MCLRFALSLFVIYSYSTDFKPLNQSVLQQVDARFVGHISQGLAEMAAKSKQRGQLMEVQFDPRFNTPSFITGKLTDPSNEDPSQIALSFLQASRSKLNMDEQQAWKVIATETDELGMSHVKLHVYQAGLEVWPAEVLVHINRDGVISTVNGHYRGKTALDTQATISIDLAKQLAQTELDSPYNLKSDSKLIIYDWHVEEPLLAYKVNIHSDETPMLHEDVFVDAKTGDIINRINQICTALPSFKEPTTCTVFPNRTDNQSATVSGWRDNNNILLLNTTKPMFPGQLDTNTLAGTIYLLECQHTNQPKGLSIDVNGDGSFNDNVDTKAAGAAAYYMSKTYDWLQATFNRNSYDNQGSALRVFVNFRENANQGLDNAFWNGRELVFGDGGSFSYNWAFSLDFMTHEICHAITSSSAGLVYQFQSGALNESFSDMYAATHDDSNWLLGETIIKQEVYQSPGLRDLSNPHQGAQTQDYLHGWQPAHMNEFQNLTAAQDNGGVHINSGITNFAFYKLATAIGRAKAIQIMHRTLTNYLSKNSEFTDCRAAAERAASDLHGQGSPEQAAVSNAFAEVGIGAGTAPPPPGGTTSSTLYYPFVAPFDNYNLSYNATFTVSNVTDATLNATASYYDKDGNILFTEPFSIAPYRTLLGTSDAQTHWLKIEASGAIIGSYQHMTGDGSAWSMIPATSFIGNGMYVPHVATNSQKFWTKGAIANVRDTPSSILYVDNFDTAWSVNINAVGKAGSFDFETDLYGSYPDTSSAGGLWGFFLNYDLDANKVLEQNMTGAEIFGRKDVNQIAGLITDASSGRAILFTHVAANTQIFWTGYSVINLTDQTAQVEVTAYDNAGSLLANNIVAIPAYGKLLRVTGDSLVPNGTSWFLVSGLSERTVLAGMELFGSLDDRQLAGFQATPLVGKKFYFPFVISGSSNRPDQFTGLSPSWTGLSVVNPNNTPIDLTIRIYRFDGQVAQGTTTLAGNNKLLNTINGLLGVSDFYGYVEIEASQAVAGFSLSGFDNQQELAGNPMVFTD